MLENHAPPVRRRADLKSGRGLSSGCRRAQGAGTDRDLGNEPMVASLTTPIQATPIATTPTQPFLEPPLLLNPHGAARPSHQHGGLKLPLPARPGEGRCLPDILGSVARSL